jgi:hypothetical protein
LAVPPPLGGWDRDISTSEELLQYATAYDTLLGAGYDLGDAAPTIVRNLVDLASELYDNYVHPETASTFTNLHQNNHRSKSGAALVVAAIALAYYTPDAGTDPRGVREPTAWLEYGLDQVDLIMRYVLVTGDGAYGEGPFYMRYAAQNLLPFARAWNRLTGGQTWMARGVEVPSLWRHPLFARTQRWMLDMTLPDGSSAPVDDANPGRSYYFGAVQAAAHDAAAFAWLWANSPDPYATEGNVDLAADGIVTYDDSVAAAVPPGSPTAFYFEGGNAIFRSDWSPNAVVAIVQAEHDTASEFGRDRNGLGVLPESHEHAEPGAFLLHAFGERLVLDPGYIDFGQRTLVNKPEDHNLILVDGAGPVDYLDASFHWIGKRAGRPPADGQATLSDTLDSGFVDAARVTSRYGKPAAHAAQIERRFLFLDDRYLFIADTTRARGGAPRTYTWLLHGNGGGTTSGSFETTGVGGRWRHGAARLDSAIAFDVGSPSVGPPSFETGTATHEDPGKVVLTHTVLRATATGATVRSAQLVYPTLANDAAPDASPVAIEHGAGLLLTDIPGDRRVLAIHRAKPATALVIPGAATGLGDAATDGTVAVFDTHLNGALRAAWEEDATTLSYAGTTYLAGTTRGNLGLHFGPDRAEVVAANSDRTVAVTGLPFAPAAADGACRLEVRAGVPVVTLGRERRFTLRAGGRNARPAAAPGPDQRVAPGLIVWLDGSASCDANGDALTPGWQLVSAPAGSAWLLEGSDTWTPRLHADRIGPYRVQLVVTDSDGAASLPAQVLIIAGTPCEDGIDNDVDGLIDSDDPDCDTPVACVGDCSGDAEVSIDEVIVGVGIAVGDRPLDACPSFDSNADGQVTIDELVAAVNAALNGCATPLR